MQGNKKDYKNVIITNVEKQIQPKMIELFLSLNKLKDQVKAFNKVGNQIHLEFISEESAGIFIEKHNHISKIMSKRFNIFYSFFSRNSQQSYSRFQVLGVKQQNRRKIYDICKSYGPCHFKMAYDGQKLNPSMIIYFQQIQPQKIDELRQNIQPLSIKLRVEDNYGDFDKFRCSIEWSNFAQIGSESLTKQEENELKLKVLEMVKAFTPEQTVGLQLHTYPQRQGHKVKAYFRFKTVQLTFQVFQQIRLTLHHAPQQIRSRLYYFQNDANSFYTLFTIGIINNQGLSYKEFEDQLLKAFRKVNPNITQILLNFIQDVYTGKIYFKTQADGKDFLATYSKKREHYYMFYKHGTHVRIDIFQTEKQIKNQFKYQKNAKDMLVHLNSNRPKPLIQQLAPQVYPKYQYQKDYSNKTNKYPYRQKQPQYNGKKERTQYRFKEKQQEKLNDCQVKKVEKKPEFKLNEDDFPTL